ncbi:hypothetical protein [Novosphingobium sp. JCM 18896]|uniref:hypothetical protein n=1 Tax=Novosphingobium sp. JCM 18896 TaxID=2989731 RepID=UPI002222B46A|nr:hypothetical protein [Novosphingobium sp. JCM 18896]MCW1429448.1 hypothetical protein [Novosphingobium sp. JCM 18896]
MSFALALLAAQVGALNTPGAAPPLPHERDATPLRPPPRNRAKAAGAPAPIAAEKVCPQTGDFAADADASRAWAARASGTERAKANECLGTLLGMTGRWTESATAFGEARQEAGTPQWRARLGAAAGEAALNASDPATALTMLDAAIVDALDSPAMSGFVALLRARALVALKRDAEAEAPLAQARAAAPNDAEIWLLSATLSRRLNKLTEAQAQIEKAAALKPVDPAIGLEAGVIAVLGGRDEAARRSWQSVMSTAPDSAEASTAKGYLAQLDPALAAKPTPKPTEPPSR